MSWHKQYYCCHYKKLSISSLWVLRKVQAALCRFIVSLLGCIGTMKTPECVEEFLLAAGKVSDNKYVSGTGTAWYPDSKDWTVTSGEKCWRGQFERCSRWRIQTSVRTDWQLDSYLFTPTFNTGVCLRALRRRKHKKVLATFHLIVPISGDSFCISGFITQK